MLLKTMHMFFHMRIIDLKQTGNRRTVPQLSKGLYKKPIASIILSGEKLKPFPLKAGGR
jgi:hypothetical protein